MQNWTLFRSNPAFVHMSKLGGILVTLGLCEASSLNFSIAGFKLFDERLYNVHLTSLDAIDALFNTITFFAESAHLCFKTGSIRPLFISDHAGIELDADYATIIQHWELVRSGNLERVAGVTDQAFDNMLEKTTTKYREMLPALKGLDKKLISDKITKLLTIKNDYVTMKISCGVREAPFLVELFGESSQGKTTFGEMLLDAMLLSQNLPLDEEYRATINPSEKFMSTVTSKTISFKIDDMSSTKSTHQSVAPTQFVIDLGNNQTYSVPKAEVTDKGRCFFLALLGLITTNIKNLDAYIYSNCPYSIQRRMNVVITVVAKKQFQRLSEDGETCGIDPDKVREHYTIDGVYTPPIIDDIWELTVERAVKPKNLNEIAKYEIVKWKGEPLRNVDSSTVIQYCIENFAKHRLAQKALLDSQKNRIGNMKRCHAEGCKHIEGHCPDHLPKEMSPHFGLTLAKSVVRNTISSCFQAALVPIEAIATAALYKTTKKFLKNWDWLPCLPSRVVDNSLFQKLMMLQDIPKLCRMYAWRTALNVTVPVVVACIAPRFKECAIFYSVLSQIAMKETVKNNYIKQLKKRNDLCPAIIKDYRDGNSRSLYYACAAMASVFALVKICKAWRRVNYPQGNLAPTSTSDIESRDAEYSPWTKVERFDLPRDEIHQTTTSSQLEGKLAKNQTYITMTNDKGENLMVNGTFVCSNAVMIPNHYFSRGDVFECRAVKHEKIESCGAAFNTTLSKFASVLIPDTDMRMCYSPTGGSFANIISHFPDNPLPASPFNMTWRRKSGDFIRMSGMSVPGKASNTVSTFIGGTYRNLTQNTFAGMCGAVAISDSVGSSILGIHLGGREGTPQGCYGTFTKSQIKQALMELRKVPGVLITGDGGNFSDVVLDTKITTNAPLHEKSPLNFMPHNSQIEYFGTCIGGATQSSDVKTSLISESVNEVCDVPNTWGPPKMNPSWFGWQTCLSVASTPARSFDHALLAKSIGDYLAPLLELIQTEYWVKLKPLNDDETMCGIKGVRFVDSINASTAIGFPLTGPKGKYILELEATEEYPHLREFTPRIIEEIDRCHNLYKQGKRAYTVAKACKKDEVLPLGKDKCRIFYGNPIALTFLVRKYFLPIIRFMQMNPLIAECAVGINCHSEEWGQMHEFMTHFGEDRTFAGDYSKYDQRMPSQLIIASLRILIDLARVCDYSETDLKVMEAMTGDLVFALIAFNGDLIGLQEGTHISGNSLTVIINGIVGSLNLRCAYFNEYPTDASFRKYVNIMTYGDDNKGSVSRWRGRFNIKSCSAFLARYGQTYTMPDKESELVEYMKDEDAEFLKRKNVYHPALGHSVGALQEDSIFKSLHNYVRGKKSPITEREACAQNVDGALMEWFNHGEEIYEKRRAQMIDVAQMSDITHMCGRLDKDYSTLAAAWIEKYQGKVRKPGDSGC